MSQTSYEHMEAIFHPRSVALAGISISNPDHWTRVFFKSLVAFQFKGPMYLVNPKGGQVDGHKVYRSLQEIPGTVDYVISTVGARAAPSLVEEAAAKEARAIHFCTAGFSETGEAEGIKLEAELLDAARRKGLRLIGPNCMGIYCPGSRLSFDPSFPRENGPAALISQSGGNATSIVRQAAWRGIRFSKGVSFGNARDLNESDFLEYFAADPGTEVIAMYIEGARDGNRFRRALEKAAAAKTVILLKGGVSEGGARAAAGHTGSLAGSELIWDAMCRQLGVIRARSLDELIDALETRLFLPPVKGRRVVLLGAGGGNSVLIADEFEKRGLKLPPLPQEIRDRIRQFSAAAGNIFRNPIDYSQTFMEAEKVAEVVRILSAWEGVDLLIGFLDLAGFTGNEDFSPWVDGMLEASKKAAKPVAAVLQFSVVPEDMKQLVPLAQKFAAARLPIYLSFAGAASGINLMVSHYENPARRKA